MAFFFPPASVFRHGALQEILISDPCMEAGKMRDAEPDRAQKTHWATEIDQRPTIRLPVFQKRFRDVNNNSNAFVITGFPSKAQELRRIAAARARLSWPMAAAYCPRLLTIARGAAENVASRG